MNDQNTPVEPASPGESYDFLLEDGIRPNGMTELEIYKRVAIRRYVERRGAFCLNCGELDIEAGSYEADDNWVTFEVTCNNCGATWKDLHTLTDVVDLVLPEEQEDGSK